MTLATIVSTLLASSDADLMVYLSTVQQSSLLNSLDTFLTRSIALQTRVDCDDNESQVAAARALSGDSRVVFSLFLRLAEAPPQALQLAVDCGLLHVTRLVPFCQLYGVKNASAVSDVLDALVNNVASFSTNIVTLRQLYMQQFHSLHKAVGQTKRDQAVDLTRNMYELCLSVGGMTTCSSVTELLLLDGKELELVLEHKSMLYSLMQCYEASLPALKRNESTFDDKAQTQLRLLIAKSRHVLLEVLGRCVDIALLQTDSPSGEKLLAGLHALCTGCMDNDAEHGSFLSDLWHLCTYKEKVADFFDRYKLDAENFSYLNMIIEELPRRRILPTMLVDDLAAEAKPKTTTSVDMKECTPCETAVVGEEMNPASCQDDGMETMVASMVHQVKDFFPDLGEGYVELCLLSSNMQVDVVVNFLLESNPPPILLDVPKDLQRSDSEFAWLEAQITGKPAPAPRLEDSTKLDPSRVWVGKKMMERTYDPQVAKNDQRLIDKMKELVLIYEDEDDEEGVYSGVGTKDGDVGALDEYDDDYNDEFDDFVPFSIRDGGSADDQDAIREQNRKIRAKEAKDAFWEGMKNRNRDNSMLSAQDHEDGESEEEKEELAEQKPSRPVPCPPQSSAGPKHKPIRRKDNEKKSDEPPTPQQIHRQRARKDKNKAKVANHNRKDRALKKMG